MTAGRFVGDFGDVGYGIDPSKNGIKYDHHYEGIEDLPIEFVFLADNTMLQ